MSSLTATSTLSKTDFESIQVFGRRIGEKVLAATKVIEEFLTWIGNRALSIASFNEASAAFSVGLRSSCKSDSHAKNLERVVWDLFQNPGWLLIDTNRCRNKKLNIARCRQIRALEDLTESKSDSIKPILNPLMVCGICQLPGRIIICEGPGCIKRYHTACAGLDNRIINKIQHWYCESCSKSIKDPQAPKIVKRQERNEKRNAQRKKRKMSGNISRVREQSTKEPMCLSSWSFKSSIAKRYLGFRVIGILVSTPNLQPNGQLGQDWFSTEIRSIHSVGVVASSSNSLYKLVGPAAPERHHADPRLVHIMMPFKNATWPKNAQKLIEQVSAF